MTRPHPKSRSPLAPRRWAQVTVFALAALATGPLPSCSSAPTSAPLPPRTSELVTDAAPLLLLADSFNAITTEELGITDPRQLAGAAWDDGTPLNAALFIPTLLAQTSPLSAWVAAVGSFSADNPPALGPLPAGTRALFLTPPAPTSKSLLIQGHHRRVFFASPVVASPAALAANLTSDVATSPLVSAALAAEAASPVSRWHARFLRGTLATSPDPAPDRFESPTIEGWSRAIESQWRLGLNNLEQASPAIAARLRVRLAAVLRCKTDASSVLAPAWPRDGRSLSRLLASLIDPALAPADRARRADLWLDGQPRAWVGVTQSRVPTPPQDRPLSLLCVANLSAAPGLTWAWADGADELDRTLQPVVELPAMSMGPLRAVGPLPPLPPAVPTRVRIANEQRTLDLHPSVIPAAPPSVALEPLRGQWTLDTWLANAADPRTAPITNGGVAVTLTRRAGANAPGEGWFVFIQVASEPPPAGTAQPAIDPVVRLWLDDGAKALTLRPATESVTEERATAQGLEPVRPVAQAEFRRTGAGWSATVPLPLRASTHELLVSVERIDRTGARWTWPHEAFPWEPVPHPACIDLTAWDAPKPGT